MKQIELKNLLWYDKSTGDFRWRFAKKYGLIPAWSKAGWDDNGYTRIQIGNKSYLAHRLAWLYEYGEMPLLDIDHINGNKKDNRIFNLRDVSRQINTQNRRGAPRNSASGILGIHKHHPQKWVAGIYVNKKRKHLGVFATQEEAQQAYLNAKRELHEGCTL